MATCGREIAKFFSGMVAGETIGHWWMGIWGKELLPMTIGGFTFTKTMNTGAMIVWPIVLAALVYFAWIRKPRSRGPEIRPVLHPNA